MIRFQMKCYISFNLLIYWKSGGQGAGPSGSGSAGQVAGASGRSEKAAPAKREQPGVAALNKTRAYQQSTGLLIPRAPFSRLVHEIVPKDYELTDMQGPIRSAGQRTSG